MGQRAPLPPVHQAYGVGAFSGSNRYGPIDHPDGATVLVLGLLSLLCPLILGPFAWSKGNKAIRQIDANPGRYSGRGMVQTGRILGILTSCLVMLVILLAITGAVAGVMSGGTDDPAAHQRACRTEQATIRSAARAWELSYRTPPTSVDQLAGPQGFLDENSGNFQLVPVGTGVTPEVVAVPGGDCG